MNAIFLLLAALAVRNPFWPVDYDGPLEAISAEPKIEITVPGGAESEEAATAAMVAVDVPKANPNEIQPRHWQDAAHQLHPSGSTTVTRADGSVFHGFIINGRTYGIGDRISITHEERRFTWIITGRTESGGPKLKRHQAHLIKTDSKGEDTP